MGGTEREMGGPLTTMVAVAVLTPVITPMRRAAGWERLDVTGHRRGRLGVSLVSGSSLSLAYRTSFKRF